MAIPEWAQDLLLNNSGEPQIMVGEMDMGFTDFYSQQLLSASNPTNPDEIIRFQRRGIIGSADIRFSKDNINFLTLFRRPGQGFSHGLITAFADTSMRNLTSDIVRCIDLEVPSSLVIAPFPNPKLNPIQLVQGGTIAVNITKFCFQYAYNPLAFNAITFDLSYFPTPRSFTFFLKNLTGLVDLPANLLFDSETGLLTITDIPADAGVCSAMLFFF